MEKKRVKLCPGAEMLIPLGVGILFTMIGLFIPDMGVMYAGLFTPLVLFAGLGIIVIIFSIVGIAQEILQIRDNRGNPEEEIIVQGTGGAFMIIPGAIILLMSSVFVVVAHLVPGGILDEGMTSELTTFALAGAGFGFIGLSFLITYIIGLKSTFLYRKLKNDPSAFTTKATYESEEKSSSYMRTSNALTGSYELKEYIVYSYRDEFGVKRYAESEKMYNECQKVWFLKKQTFLIKCKGKYSVIIEEPPEDYVCDQGFEE